jgi:dipeptidyl aminopeptidase/acylaminoacyl peptidase
MTTRKELLFGIAILLIIGVLLVSQPLPLSVYGEGGNQRLLGGRGLQVATPIPTPTTVPPLDGTLDSITLIHYTDRSAYYAIVYWSDGFRVTGFLGRPLAPGTHPAIIVNRGGYGETGALIGAEIVPYVEAGYVAVASQYRGNRGGEGLQDFGGDDVHDVTNLITLLAARPDVDPARIGMVGGSVGGMMTFIAIKNETLAGLNRIRAAAAVGGISDLFLWDRNYGGLYQFDAVLWRPLVGATPAEAPDQFEARSAIYWPELITTPLLLLHGEADDSVSIQNTYALADALERAGHPASVITYPGGDHALTAFDGGLPDILDWFGLHLGGDGVDRRFATHADAIGAVQTWFVANSP